MWSRCQFAGQVKHMRHTQTVGGSHWLVVHPDLREPVTALQMQSDTLTGPVAVRC